MKNVLFTKLFLLFTLLCANSYAETEVPPPGAPWLSDLAKAQKQAIKRKLPLLIYSSKICPHCKIFEREVLTKKEISKVYSKAVWLYVYRDFSGSKKDLANDRINLRMGFTTWPNCWLIDPITLKKIIRVDQYGRTVNSFLGAFREGATKTSRRGARKAVENLVEAEKRKKELFSEGTTSAALTALKDDDILVKLMAVRLLAEKAPMQIVKNYSKLLKIPNDQVKFEVLEVLRTHGNTSCARTLEALIKKPFRSLNPNVTRIRAVMALGEKCGNRKSVKVIAPFAKGEWNNSLTTVSVTALLEIGKREGGSLKAVSKALIAAFPSEPKIQKKLGAKWANTAKVDTNTLAMHVHNALTQLMGVSHPFPSSYNRKSKIALMKMWKSTKPQKNSANR